MLKLLFQYFGHVMQRANSWKRPWCWERLRTEGEGGATENEMLLGIIDSGHEFEQTPGDSGGQGSQACCSPWGHIVGHILATKQQCFGYCKHYCSDLFCCLISPSLPSFVFDLLVYLFHFKKISLSVTLVIMICYVYINLVRNDSNLTFYLYIWVYFKYIAGLILEHHSKANSTIKLRESLEFFSFPVMFGLNYSSLSIQCYYVLNDVHTFIYIYKNTLLGRHASHHLSLQLFVVFLLKEGHASVLIAAEWLGWLFPKARVTVAVS